MRWLEGSRLSPMQMANGLKANIWTPDAVTTAATMADRKRKKQTKTAATVALFSQRPLFAGLTVDLQRKLLHRSSYSTENYTIIFKHLCCFHYLSLR